MSALPDSGYTRGLLAHLAALTRNQILGRRQRSLDDDDQRHVLGGRKLVGLVDAERYGPTNPNRKSGREGEAILRTRRL